MPVEKDKLLKLVDKTYKATKTQADAIENIKRVAEAAKKAATTSTGKKA